MNAKYNENPTWYNTFHSLPTHNGADGEPISKVTKIIGNVSWEPTWSQLFCTGMGFRRCDMHNTPCLCRKVAVEGDWALKAD